MIIASLLLALYGCGVCLLLSGQKKAYVAAQDELGFHSVWLNNSPQVKNTCVVWKS
jgi:hypothetical protein